MRTKRILSIVLTLAMLLGMLPGMSLTAYAEGNAMEITPTNTSGTMTITLTIKAAQTITATDVTATYGDTDKSVSASVTTPASGGGTITYAVKDGSADYIDVDASTGALTIKKVGTATVVVTAAETGTYAQATKEVTVTINKANAVAATVTANNRTYDGTEKPLVTVTGEATGGTMYYAVTTENTAPTDDNLYTTSIPAKTDAGTYYVWYKVVGDASHLDTTPGCVTVSIGKTELNNVTVYAIPDQNSTGSPLTPKPVVKHQGYLLIEGTDYTLSYANNVNRWESGENPPTVTVTGMGGYSGTLTRTFKIILPAYNGTLTVTAPSAYTYGDTLGTEPTVSGASSSETVTVYYATTPSGTGTLWNPSAKLNAGTYYVWAELAATETHDKATSVRVPFTVRKATPNAPSGVLATTGYQNTYKVALTIPRGKSYSDYEYVVSTSESTPAAEAWKSLPALKEASFTPPEATAQNTTYHVFLRTKADSNNDASAAATATLITPAKVLLSYDANGSTASVPASVEYNCGTTATAAAAISRPGYTFASWNEAASGGTAHAESSTFSITANTTLYAQWTPITYSVDYHENGGNACTDETGKAYNAVITLPTPTYAEHTFNGWATVSSGSPVYRGGQNVSGLTSVNGATVNLYAVWTENTYQVTGEVKEELDGTTQESIVAGVTVKLMRGNVQFGDTQTTDDNGKYTFTGVPAGTYNIVATRKIDPSTDKTQTMTALVAVKSDQKVDPIVLPPSKINSVLSVTGASTPPVMVGGLEEVAKDNADKNTDVTVTMTVEKKDENAAGIGTETKKEIEEIKEVVASDQSTVGEKTELEFLDVQMKKTVGDGAATAITEASKVVEMIVPFQTTGRKNFGIYRHHDGRATAFKSRTSRFGNTAFEDGWFFADLSSGMIYIYTNRFSTYAIGFEEVTGNTENESGNNNGNGTNDSGKSGSGSGSSASGNSSGGAATTSTVKVPVSGETGSISVSASIDGSTATVKAPSSDELKKVIGNDKTNGEVTIDVSKLNKDITGVVVPKETVSAIEKASKDKGEQKVLTIKLSDGSVSFDANALSAIVSQSDGNAIKFNLDAILLEKLGSDQKTALKDMDVRTAMDAYITCNGKRISDFNGGIATLAIKFSPEAGRNAENYNVFYVPDSGAAEKLATTYADNEFTAKVTHFSNYVLVYDESVSDDSGDTDGSTNEIVIDEDKDFGSDAKTANGKTEYENGLSINRGLKVSQTGKKITVKWGKIKGADGYNVYIQYCGKAFSKEPVKSVSSNKTSVSVTKLNGKKLDLKKNYKVCVVAYKTVDGEKQLLGKTIVAHVVGSKNTKYSNPKKLTIKSKTKVTLKKGKTTKIKATVTLVNKKRKSLTKAHAAKFRYASSDKKIATVTKNGKVKALKKGTCYIYVYAKNGYAKKVKITVK